MLSEPRQRAVAVRCTLHTPSIGAQRGPVLLALYAPRWCSLDAPPGYDDDEDFGDVIVYTGDGGQDGKNR